MQTVAIIGGKGFIGKYLVEHFCTDNHVISLHRSAQKPTNQLDSSMISNVDDIYWDITSQYNGPSIRVDTCIHTAASVDYMGQYEDLYRTNVASIKNIVQFAEYSRCSHLIYLSSSSVYMGKSGVIAESSIIEKTALKNPYALTKYEAEEQLKKLLPKHIKLTILRPRAVYGPGDKNLLPQILSHTWHKYLCMPGLGANTTSVTSIQSMVEAIEVCIKNQSMQSEIYNVCDSTIWRYKGIYEEIVIAKKLKGIVHIPERIIEILTHIRPKKWQYLNDSFMKDKILNTEKIKNIGFVGVDKLKKTIISL